jgi:formylmethanofuran dehydrogenase subunit E
MKYPEFFNEVETIKLQDDLANILGAFEDGLIEFTYKDVVKSAGHSCPTVAGAYLIVKEGLKELYKNELPKRGEIKVSFKEDLEDGVAGVISNVVSQITGATSKSGFKGLNGKFARHSLMEFNDNIKSSIKLTRIDTNQSVEVLYNPNSILPHKDMSSLMQKVMSGMANKDEKILFGQLWQERVEQILINPSEVIVIL